MEREKNIWMVEQSRIGDVKITDTVKEEFIHDGLIIESGFTKDDVISIIANDFCGVSFENCLLNEDELYISNILRK